MESIQKITRLHFVALFNWQIVSCIAVLLLNLMISVAVLRLADTDGPAGSGDFIALIWMPIMGIIFFSPSFRYMLSQGVSRKTFFLAGSLSIVMMAAVLTVVVFIMYVINTKVANVWMCYELIYNDNTLPSLIAWEFAALLFLGMLGWLIRLIYYRSNRITQLFVSIAPFVLAALLVLFNALADGGIGRALLDFLKTLMGLSYSTPNPYIGMASMLVASIILGIPVFLLLRRAQTND